MAERVSNARPLQRGPSHKKLVKNTPWASRSSLVGLNRLPEPEDAMIKIINEDVYQRHEDSSDEELLTDEAFKHASKDCTHELIHSLHDDHITAISESIR